MHLFNETAATILQEYISCTNNSTHSSGARICAMVQIFDADVGVRDEDLHTAIMPISTRPFGGRELYRRSSLCQLTLEES